MALSKDEITQLKHMRGNGFTHQEIADKLSVSRKTVENHLHRLRREYKPISLDLAAAEAGAQLLGEMMDDYVKWKAEQQGRA